MRVYLDVKEIEIKLDPKEEERIICDLTNCKKAKAEDISDEIISTLKRYGINIG